MSDNLIERLRTERSVYDAELCDEAADALEAMQKDIADIVNMYHEREMANLKRIEELGSALREIAGTDDYSPAVDCVFIAKQALKERDDE